MSVMSAAHPHLGNCFLIRAVLIADAVVSIALGNLVGRTAELGGELHKRLIARALLQQQVGMAQLGEVEAASGRLVVSAAGNCQLLVDFGRGFIEAAFVSLVSVKLAVVGEVGRVVHGVLRCWWSDIKRNVDRGLYDTLSRFQRSDERQATKSPAHGRAVGLAVGAYRQVMPPVDWLGKQFFTLLAGDSAGGGRMASSATQSMPRALMALSSTVSRRSMDGRSTASPL